MEQGLIHIYCGDGKGKTTCAFGLALRCAGAGGKVRIVQFLKGGQTGEVTAIQHVPHVELLRAKRGTKFTFQMNAQERAQARAEHQALLDAAFTQADGLRMLVLDEIMAACSTGMVEEQHLVALLARKPEQLEIVMTGRNPSDKLLALADYITEMKKVRHPYDRGIAARTGIER
ncbi:MAG: cob(I)yrinic acid a,c-diamide adenosyltransferase [Eubacteriales bacterium]|nr:cob(I)yrinic acid a,c-diamide adenosyltransferase [Eubacteriales bacterium]